jgi:hypothetical protein
VDVLTGGVSYDTVGESEALHRRQTVIGASAIGGTGVHEIELEVVESPFVDEDLDYPSQVILDLPIADVQAVEPRVFSPIGIPGSANRTSVRLG